MSSKINWRDQEIEVKAGFVPQKAWIAASVDVYLGQEKILSTGGQLKFKGSCVGQFDRGKERHMVRLDWDRLLMRPFPCSLYIDEEMVFQGQVEPSNRLMNVVILVLLNTLVVFLCLLRASAGETLVKILRGQ